MESSETSLAILTGIGTSTYDHCALCPRYLYRWYCRERRVLPFWPSLQHRSRSKDVHPRTQSAPIANPRPPVRRSRRQRPGTLLCTRNRLLCDTVSDATVPPHCQPQTANFTRNARDNRDELLACPGNLFPAEPLFSNLNYGSFLTFCNSTCFCHDHRIHGRLRRFTLSLVMRLVLYCLLPNCHVGGRKHPNGKI